MRIKSGLSEGDFAPPFAGSRIRFLWPLAKIELMSPSLWKLPAFLSLVSGSLVSGEDLPHPTPFLSSAMPDEVNAPVDPDQNQIAVSRAQQPFCHWKQQLIPMCPELNRNWLGFERGRESTPQSTQR